MPQRRGRRATCSSVAASNTQSLNGAIAQWDEKLPEPVTDTDGDDVDDPDDVCTGTIIPGTVPTVGLRPNRWALLDDGDTNFDTVSRGRGRGPGRSYTITDTAGCSCQQIIVVQGLGNGHTKFGCSISAMDDWTALVNP